MYKLNTETIKMTLLIKYIAIEYTQHIGFNFSYSTVYGIL